MVGIPEDVIDEILLRLPVEALVRFRCVSKRWRNLIDSPNFVNSQFNLPNKPQFVMVVVFDKKLRIFFSELNSEYIENPWPTNLRELPIPWRNEISSGVSDVVGHCNGLLCCICESDRSYLVLNPFTGKHIQVPPPEQQGCMLSTSGFGYDWDSDDYKVVALGNSNDRGNYSGVLWIYSLKSGSWEKTDGFPRIHAESNGVFVNGVLYWIAYHEDDPCKCIFAVVLGSLQHFLVGHPSDDCKKMYLGNLGVLDGYLYALYYGCYDEFPYGYGFWVMTMEESWTRLCTYGDIYHARDRLFVSYDNWLIQCHFGSFWRKLWDDEPYGRVPIGTTLVCEPSLVCVPSGVGEDKEDS